VAKTTHTTTQNKWRTKEKTPHHISDVANAKQLIDECRLE
jgi:hypothetical protein